MKTKLWIPDKTFIIVLFLENSENRKQRAGRLAFAKPHHCRLDTEPMFEKRARRILKNAPRKAEAGGPL